MSLEIHFLAFLEQNCVKEISYGLRIFLKISTAPDTSEVRQCSRGLLQGVYANVRVLLAHLR